MGIGVIEIEGLRIMIIMIINNRRKEIRLHFRLD